MLIRNESRIKHSIQIKLVFDDDKTRELEIQEYDQIQVSYRKNGCLRQGVGVIRDIKPYIQTRKFSFCKRESAIITLDMSEDHVSCVDKFDLYDIIDIRKLECLKPEDIVDTDSDFTASKPRCMSGCPIVKDGVKIDD